MLAHAIHEVHGQSVSGVRMRSLVKAEQEMGEKDVTRSAIIGPPGALSSFQTSLRRMGPLNDCGSTTWPRCVITMAEVLASDTAASRTAGISSRHA